MTNEKITLSEQQLIFVNTCTSHHQGIISRVKKRSIHMKAITLNDRTAERNVFCHSTNLNVKKMSWELVSYGR